MNNYFTKAGIQARLTLAIFIVALLPLSLLGYKAYNDQMDIIHKEVTASHLELSNTLAHGIYENLEFSRRILSTIGEVDAIKLMQKEGAENYFDSLMRHFSFFKSIYLINSQKEVVASTEPNRTLPSNWLYSQAIQRSYQGSLSPVVFQPDGVPYMTLESIIKAPENNGIGGVLISEINLLGIKDLLRNALKNSKSQGLVLDEAGTVIAKSSNLVHTLSIPSSEAATEDITRLKTLEGEPYLITAVSLKKFDFYQAPNWVIILQIPERIAFESAISFKGRMIHILLITALIAITLSVMLSHSFTAPLKNLIEEAKHLSEGNFEHEIKPMRNDEIGVLTKTFDEMRINLKTTREDLDYRILQLSTLFEVGKAISSELNFRKLQDMILEISVKVTKAERGSLMLLDDAEKLLSIGVAVGLNEDIAKDIKIEIGQSVAGWVAKNRQPLFIEDVETDSIFKSIKKVNVRTGTLMCMPLTAKDKTLGTLNVSRSEPYSFTEKDFELFVNLANQAAIAIDNARLYRYAVTDEMTKLYNHRYFQQRLDEELQRCDRYSGHVSLILIDVDHFKAFNDTYGHPEGDRVLKTVARLIEDSIREIDIASRYGGEEFTVICPERNTEGSMVPAERIRQAIEGYEFKIKGVTVPLTISVGVACYPELAKTKKELISRADKALYYSKHNGRNRSSLYHPIMENSQSKS
jgi:diguanylate cyclase (GGDEF)-like protein